MAADGRDDYLALGDSLAFGLDPFRPVADRSDASNFVGYPDVLAKALDLDLTNASCPGEATGGFISLTGVDRRCRTFYRARYPIHVSYTTSQLDFAVAYLRSHPR
ncbi:MAG TPA: SGNH/GDSL hydrolase family protein, partial [Chloroflexota bacterium]